MSEPTIRVIRHGDFTELIPALDHADVTSHLAAHLLFEGLALGALAARRRADRHS